MKFNKLLFSNKENLKQSLIKVLLVKIIIIQSLDCFVLWVLLEVSLIKNNQSLAKTLKIRFHLLIKIQFTFIKILFVK